MTGPGDPFNCPEWHALHREASLVSQLIGAGTTALGRASYASAFGEYYTAFFGLSIGIERLAKMILIADYMLEHKGTLPDQNAVRKFGHKLSKLIEEVDRIAKKHDLRLEIFALRGKKLPLRKPDCEISIAVIHCLDAFADASRGRYANFEAIGNPAFNAAEEPVAKWWREVVERILDKHYRGTRAEEGVKARAKLIDSMIGDMTTVRYFDEGGETMTQVATASERTGQSKWAQKYERVYTLSIVRWLATIFSELTMTRGYEAGFEVLFGHYEFFETFCNDDSSLLTRKRWPLR
jgi:hypothetical protein